MQSALHDVDTACAAGSIRVPTDVCGVLLLTRQRVHAIVDLQSSHSARLAALSKKDDAMHCVSIVEVERDDAFRRDTLLDSFLTAKYAKLQTVQRATK